MLNKIIKERNNNINYKNYIVHIKLKSNILSNKFILVKQINEINIKYKFYFTII